MNKSHRIVWSEAQQTWVVVSEVNKAHGKRSRGMMASLALAALTSLLGISNADAQIYLRPDPSGLDTTSPAVAGGGTVVLGTAPAGSGSGTATNGVIIGAGVVGNSVTGDANVAIGAHTGNNVTGGNNSSIGTWAGAFVTGTGNSGIGAGSGSAVSGDGNFAGGLNSGQWITGSSNVSIGNGAHQIFGGPSVTGDHNVAIGTDAGDGVTGSANVAIGINAGTSVSGTSNLALGNGAGNNITADNTTPGSPLASVSVPERRGAWLEEGTFVNAHNLGKVMPGLSKDQVYDLLGVPHFKEGIAGVREWNYLFNFRTGGNEYVTCQYQIHYDRDMKLHSSYWNSRECAELAVERPVMVERTVEKIVEKSMARKAQLSADALFAFGKSGAADITAQGWDELKRLAAELRGLDDIETIMVTGHTDRFPPLWPAYAGSFWDVRQEGQGGSRGIVEG